MTDCGPIALVGGHAFDDGCEFDLELAKSAGTEEVVVLPTASAYERPETRVAQAQAWFDRIGLGMRALPVLTRRDALDEDLATAVRGARFVYFTGGSPLHLRSVLKATPVWDALVAAWREGAAIAGSSAGAMVLTDPMVDPRGGAFTLGLGLITSVAIIPHGDQVDGDRLRRTLTLAGDKLPVAAIEERTALLRDPDGAWRVAGAGTVRVWCGGREVGLEALPT